MFSVYEIETKPPQKQQQPKPKTKQKQNKTKTTKKQEKILKISKGFSMTFSQNMMELISLPVEDYHMVHQ